MLAITASRSVYVRLATDFSTELNAAGKTAKLKLDAVAVATVIIRKRYRLDLGVRRIHRCRGKSCMFAFSYRHPEIIQ